MRTNRLIAMVCAVMLLLPAGISVAAEATKSDVAKADAARKKPLQRCDQLNDKAEIECLQKARERVVEARRQRESSGKRDDKHVGKDVPRDTSAKNPAKKAAADK